MTNKCATTYALFAGDEEPSTARARALLQMLSGASLAEDLVAWTMVEYNGYFGGLLAQRAAAAGSTEGQGLLRVQEAEDKGAVYALAAPGGGQVCWTFDSDLYDPPKDSSDMHDLVMCPHSDLCFF